MKAIELVGYLLEHIEEHGNTEIIIHNNSDESYGNYDIDDVYSDYDTDGFIIYI